MAKTKERQPEVVVLEAEPGIAEQVAALPRVTEDTPTRPVLVAQPSDTPLKLIAAAIEKGLDPDKLGKLMDLQERYEKSRAIEAYNQAMANCQRKMPAVVKDADNKHTRSRYARLETVIHAIRPIYTENGFSITFDEADCPKPDHVRIVANLMHVGGHTHPIHGDFALDGKGAQGNATAMNQVQAKGSTIAYARRYLTLMAFNVAVADEDMDGGGTGATVTPEHVEQINLLLEECRENGNPVPLDKLLKWQQVEQLSDLTQKQFIVVLRELNRKRRDKKKEGQP